MNPSPETTSVQLARVRDLVRSGEAREIRLRHGLSLAEVASDIGVHPTTVHHWEQGMCLPRGPHALRYAVLLRELKTIGTPRQRQVASS